MVRQVTSVTDSCSCYGCDLGCDSGNGRVTRGRDSPYQTGNLYGSPARMDSKVQSELNVQRVPRISSWVGHEPVELLPGTHLIIYRPVYTHPGSYLRNV